jgi:hypothetical protein
MKNKKLSTHCQKKKKLSAHWIQCAESFFIESLVENK